MDESTSVLTCLQRWKNATRCVSRVQRSELVLQSKQIPRTSEDRQRASLAEIPLQLPQLLIDTRNNPSNSSETVLYLGYGSNLSAETFLGKRQIKPLSQVNVVVPQISLTFDLPGIPYTEPCFGNCKYRTPPDQEKPSSTTDYHKDRWPKGLVGVVYEVTKADYAHIIATEGGGSGYQDVLVDCYALSSDPEEKVPAIPSGSSFKAHTLFAPTTLSRPDHSYAQPSPRYLKLITDGAAEHALPYEYQSFLSQIRTYHITNNRQRLGQWIFLSVWLPIFGFFFGGGGAIFLRPDGTYPAWFAALTRAIFTACWASYDGYFHKMFGDGERTIGDSNKDGIEQELSDEKEPLIQEHTRIYGVNGSGANNV